MKLCLIWFIFIVTGTIASNWASEDYEIFSLKDKVESDLGSGTTFYQWLKLPKGPKSSLEEINKAYRRLSRQSHPDKFHTASKNVQRKAEERFQRLSLVGNILRDHSLKKRYDYFLDNGFPTWRDTGYFYSRFRPGVFAVALFLYVIIGIFHFVSLKISRKQDFKRIVDMKNDLKRRAWNGSLFPPSDGSDVKVFNPINAKEFLVHSSGDVSLIESQGDNRTLHILDENDIKLEVGFKDSLFYKFPVYLYNKSLGTFFGEIKEIEDIKKPTTPQEKHKPKKTKGEKLELPNGKVIYSRANKKKK